MVDDLPTVVKIQTPSEFERVAGEWDDLVDNSVLKFGQMFHSSLWIRAAIQTNSDDWTIILLRDRGGVLLGGIALEIVSVEVLGLPCKMIRPLGSAHSGAEYCSWVLRNDLSSDAELEIARYLRTLTWDIAWFPHQKDESETKRMVSVFERIGIRTKTRMTNFSEVIFPVKFEEYVGSFSKKRRRRFRKYEDHFKDGTYKIRWVGLEDDLEHSLQRFFELHAQRWNAVGDIGSFERNPPMRRFYQQVAEMSRQKEQLKLSALEVGDSIVAMQLGFRYKNWYGALQEGFVPTCDDVGNILRFATMRDLHASGVRHYDFLGGFTEHKARWKAEESVGCHIYAARSLKGRLAMSLGVWPTGKYVRLSGGSN